jgi:hypothetical protein
MGPDNKPILITVGVIAVAIVGFLIYVAVKPEPEAPQLVQQSLTVPPASSVDASDGQEGAAATDPMLEPEPGEESSATTPTFMLPHLGESDGLIRDGVASLTENRGIDHWLEGADLIRKFVTVVDNVARGKLPHQNLAFMAPAEAFAVQRESDQVFLLDEASYRRFDLVTDIFASIDAAGAVQFYNLLRPLFQQAYEELGYGSRKFDDLIFVAIGRLLETPVLTEPVRLVRPTVVYEYADKRLENLSDAQKQLLRMGPRNTRVIQAKLSELALELRTVLKK